MTVDIPVLRGPVRVLGPAADGTAVQSYKFGHTPTRVDYDCRA